MAAGPNRAKTEGLTTLSPAGGPAVGIQPRFMVEREWSHPGLTELHLVETMAERKSLMLSSSKDAIAFAAI